MQAKFHVSLYFKEDNQTDFCTIIVAAKSLGEAVTKAEKEFKEAYPMKVEYVLVEKI
jgi:hypothetical protein